MALERGQQHASFVSSAPPEDAVVVIRRALAQAENGMPLFRGEDRETEGALNVLEDRLRRLRTLGVEFEDVGLSFYAKRLISPSQRISVAS